MTDHPSSGTEGGETPHVHTWVSVSPENSGHMEYGAECRIHGANGEEPMFFRTLNDLYLHQAADGCMSSWGPASRAWRINTVQDAAKKS